ncbi:MAG: ScyD/ScyE family protein [Candidatus Bipolaricaulia bacterium]
MQQIRYLIVVVTIALVVNLLWAWSGAAQQVSATVQEGDSLWKIAKRAYGRGSLWTLIADANGIDVANPRFLQVGERLIVPGMVTTFIAGFNSPRGLAFDGMGDLWVAEAGIGGDLLVETPVGPNCVGATGRVLKVDSERRIETVVDGLPSGVENQALSAQTGTLDCSSSDFYTVGTPGAVGLHGLLYTGGTLYMVQGAGGAPISSSLLQVGMDGLTPVASFGPFEQENNPDGAEIDSNPWAAAAAPNGFYATDAGGNTLYRVSQDGTLSPLFAWTDNPVPTALASDADGNAYVSFLTHVPFEVGTSSVVKVTPAGEVTILTGGLTMVVGLTWGPDGALYAVELGSELTERGIPPQTGRLVRVGLDGSMSVVAEGLNYPTFATMGPDDAIYVAVNSAFSPPGTGAVIRIALP